MQIGRDASLESMVDVLPRGSGFVAEREFDPRVGHWNKGSKAA